MSEMAEADPSTQRLRRRLELVRAHVDCENRHDLEGILQTFGAAPMKTKPGERATLDRKAFDFTTRSFCMLAPI